MQPYNTAAGSRQDLTGKTFCSPFPFLPPSFGPQRHQKLLTKLGEAEGRNRVKLTTQPLQLGEGRAEVWLSGRSAVWTLTTDETH